jgi:peptide-methionine (S)-S-oxide reductase
VVFDPEKIGYVDLLDVYWRNIDPTDATGQFCDKGSQYRSEIFYHDEQQKQLAEMSKQALVELKPFAGDIVTGISPATVFYPAEDYHQDYYLKNPVRYKFYRYGCGRDKRLEELWQPVD